MKVIRLQANTTDIIIRYGGDYKKELKSRRSFYGNNQYLMELDSHYSVFFVVKIVVFKAYDQMHSMYFETLNKLNFIFDSGLMSHVCVCVLASKEYFLD